MILPNMRVQLINKFHITDTDFLGFKLCKGDSFTYHHIVKKEDGGEKTLENGAVLIRKAHLLIHTIENYDSLLYDEINSFLKVINSQGHLPSDYQLDYIENLFDNYQKKLSKKILKLRKN